MDGDPEDVLFGSGARSHVGNDSVNVELGDGVLSFVAKEKVAGTVAVHESVLGECCSTSCVAEDVESCFLIRIAVGVIKAHTMTGQVLECGLTKMVGQQISGGLARRSVAAPAFRIVPFPDFDNDSPNSLTRVRDPLNQRFEGLLLRRVVYLSFAALCTNKS